MKDLQAVQDAETGKLKMALNVSEHKLDAQAEQSNTRIQELQDRLNALGKEYQKWQQGMQADMKKAAETRAKVIKAQQDELAKAQLAKEKRNNATVTREMNEADFDFDDWAYEDEGEFDISVFKNGTIPKPNFNLEHKKKANKILPEKHVSPPPPGPPEPAKRKEEEGKKEEDGGEKKEEEAKP